MHSNENMCICLPLIPTSVEATPFFFFKNVRIPTINNLAINLIHTNAHTQMHAFYPCTTLFTNMKQLYQVGRSSQCFKRLYVCIYISIIKVLKPLIKISSPLSNFFFCPLLYDVQPRLKMLIFYLSIPELSLDNLKTDQYQ